MKEQPCPKIDFTKDKFIIGYEYYVLSIVKKLIHVFITSG